MHPHPEQAVLRRTKVQNNTEITQPVKLSFFFKQFIMCSLLLYYIVIWMKKTTVTTDQVTLMCIMEYWSVRCQFMSCLRPLRVSWHLAWILYKHLLLKTVAFSSGLQLSNIIVLAGYRIWKKEWWSSLVLIIDIYKDEQRISTFSPCTKYPS